MKLSDALRKAQSLGLDVVEVAPTANPPVCKIVALGKFRYDISKHEKDKRPTGAKLKEIKFRVNIDDHDYLTLRHVSGGNGAENHGPKRDNDTFALARQPPETAIQCARENS